jgi:hypothetical protein
MSGLLRRFRRPKPKEEEEAPADAPVEPTEEDADIYPHRGPPRRRGDPDIEPEPEPRPGSVESGDEVAAEPDPVSVEIGPAPASEPSLDPPKSPGGEPDSPVPARPEPVPDGPAPEIPLPSRPPLPLADADAGRPAHRPLSAPTRCFLCGTEMNGSTCPTCRMTWNE